MPVTRVAAAQAREDLAKVVNRSARGERIKLTRYGKTQAVLIPKRDLTTLEDCEEHRASDSKKTARGKRASRPGR